MKINFSEIKIIGVDWKESKLAQPINELLANAIFTSANVLEMVDLSREIFACKEVDLREEEVKEIKRLVNDEKIWFMAFAKRSILKFIDDKALEWKQTKEEEVKAK